MNSSAPLNLSHFLRHLLIHFYLDNIYFLHTFTLITFILIKYFKYWLNFLDLIRIFLTGENDMKSLQIAERPSLFSLNAVTGSKIPKILYFSEIM